MTERLEQLNHRYEELAAQLSAPETYGDPDLVARLNREQRELEPVVTCWRNLTRSQVELEEAQELLHDPDQEVRELAREEFSRLKNQVERLREQLEVLLLPRDPSDDKDVIMEIRGRGRRGGGGAVCPLPVPDVRHVRRRQGLEYPDRQHQRDGAGGRQGSGVHRLRPGSLCPSEI